MRITAICPKYPPKSRVGAWLSTHRCLVELVERGHTVEVGTIVGRPEPSYELDGIHVHSGDGVIGRLVSQADLVVSHLGDNGKAHRAALDAGKPSVRMAHGGDVNGRTCDGASLVVFNSHSFAADVNWDGPQIVIHPPVDPDEYRTTPGDKVTLVNLSDAKGVHVFEYCARVLHDVEFLGVLGGYGAQVQPDLPNVEIIPPVVDMREVFSRTRVLLMPSIRETWGRVGVEAFASGIPVIASPTPGLQESLADAALFANVRNREHWASLVRSVLQPRRWAEQSERALRRSQQLHPADDLANFADAIEALA